MGPLRDLSPVILMARMEEITRKNSTLTNNVIAVGNRSGKKFRNVLTRAGFSIPRRKSTKKTEFARPPGTVDDRRTQRTIPQMFKSPLDAIPEDTDEDGEGEDTNPDIQRLQGGTERVKAGEDSNGGGDCSLGSSSSTCVDDGSIYVGSSSDSGSSSNTCHVGRKF
jgi:hypothetical protein